MLATNEDLFLKIGQAWAVLLGQTQFLDRQSKLIFEKRR
jgi:hypothetical protein